MDEDQIYRRAYWQSLPAGIIAAAVLTAAVGVAGGFSPWLVNHLILRVVLSFGVMWCVMQAMFYGGGGLMGFKTTATAWLLANAAMILSYVVGALIWRERHGDLGGAPADTDRLMFSLIVLLALQGLGTTLAGWVHGD